MNPLHDVFEYRDGGLYWKRSQGRATVGRRCGWPQPDGYRCVKWKSKNYGEHRLIWEYFHGVPPTNLIDHIDGNPSNNLISNLREATNAENQANRKKNKNNTSGYKGVHWNKCKKRYQVYAMVDGKQVIRYAKDFEEACRIADELRNNLHGEFAKHE